MGRGGGGIYVRLTVRVYTYDKRCWSHGCCQQPMYGDARGGNLNHPCQVYYAVTSARGTTQGAFSSLKYQIIRDQRSKGIIGVSHSYSPSMIPSLWGLQSPLNVYPLRRTCVMKLLFRDILKGGRSLKGAVFT